VGEPTVNPVLRAVAALTFVVAVAIPAEATHDVDHRDVVLGHVRDASGGPMARTIARVVREKTGLAYEARTGADGLYVVVVHLHDEDVCEQLVKLPKKLDALTTEGAALFAVSGDSTDAAARLAKELGLAFPILSDPRMVAVRAFGMYGDSMGMPEMGYVVIDKQGRVRARQVDRRFGENFDAIIRVLRDAKQAQT
jgi:peroxiredoxin